MDRCNDVLHKNKRDGKNGSHFEALAPNTMEFPIHDNFTCNFFFRDLSDKQTVVFGRPEYVDSALFYYSCFFYGEHTKSGNLELGTAIA
jgi:hypothetical protein